jgi:Zn-finger nucleic acid-binding protein
MTTPSAERVSFTIMADAPKPLLNTGDTFQLECPFDGHAMESLKARNFTIDRCTKCGSLWFDMAEMQRMIAHNLPPSDFDTFPPHAKRQRSDNCKCPRDHTNLKPTPDPKQPQVEYLACDTCGGMLLRAGDFSDLTKFTLAERVKSFFKM